MTGYAAADRDRVLARLIGPAGPQVGCEECFDQLDRYVELELAGADAEATVPGMRVHLEGCSACAEDHASLLALLASEATRSDERSPAAIRDGGV